MQIQLFKPIFALIGTAAVVVFTGCGAQPVGTNVNLANSSANTSNSLNSNVSVTNANSAASTTIVETKEPENYQATVTVKLEGIGSQQTTALPTLSAKVARGGDDRRMEFTMPAGGRVVYLDKAGTNYLILPDKKQYAELNQESLGFEVRRMLMPEQIVQQVKNLQGMTLVGEEKYNGRDAVKYRYGAVAKTGSPAGEVQTESYLLVDKETSLPLSSETVSQSQSGANVQGYTGLRVITEITDINTADAPAGLFDPPTDMQKIESSQVRSQVDMIFNALGQLVANMMNQSQQGQTQASPMNSPQR